MKKLLYLSIAVLGLAAFSACQEKEGTEPGNDSKGTITVYNYAASDEYNPDEDVRMRVINNGKVTQAKYLAELKKEKEAFIATKGEDAYLQKVLSEGTALTFTDGVCETTVQGLRDAYTVTVVGTDASNNISSGAFNFTGVAWTTVAKGTFTSNRAAVLFGQQPFETELQVMDADPTMYRIKNAYGKLYHLSFTVMEDSEDEDEGGKFVSFRVPSTATPYTYGSYGAVSVRDLGYWQDNIDYAYWNQLYEDNYVIAYVQFYVAAGSLGYNTDIFEPES